MTGILRWSVGAVLFCASMMAQPGAAPLSGFDAQWVSLFNGKDLTGWKVVGPERWSVDDGTILGEGIHSKD